uniref:Potassium channel tetramerisation-type BTB domain-containing protein n=1 Tax=Panagrolaimus sp. ES5 TaxID=591445 RepID=A0AC34FRB6_9BILA
MKMDQSSEIIQLNIGGTPYTTTFRTLCRESDSIFPQILSENTNFDKFESAISRLSDGTLFIDRGKNLKN